MKTLKNSSDANQHRKLFKVLWLVVGIVVLISTSCLTQTQIHPLAATNTAVPSISPAPSYIPLIAPTAFVPTPTMPIAEEPPPCTFPLTQTTTAESSPENYTFSEPQVVLVAPNSGLNLMQWLPDNQRALILREVVENQRAQDDSIEIFNPVTTKLQVYAKRKPTYEMLPSWVPGPDVVIYPESFVDSFSTDANGRYIPSTVVSKQLLWISNGDPNKVQNIEDVQYQLSTAPYEWVFSSLAVKPDGSQIVLLKTNGEYLFQFYSREVSQGSFGPEQLIPFDAALLNYKNYPILKYDMAWRPNTTQIFLYSQNDQAPSEGYQYLFDVSTGRICEFDFGMTPNTKSEYWVWIARWSPNGRYLAVSRGLGGTPWGDLAVLDTKTGELYTMEFYPQEIQGSQGIEGIAWAPDNYHLVAISGVGSYPHCEPNCKKYSNLYLVDFTSKKADLLFPSFQFLTGSRPDSLIWSSDGSKILATCWDGINQGYVLFLFREPVGNYAT